MNKHLELKNYIRKILAKNVSYIFILPIFDMLKVYVNSQLGKKLAISIYQYLALFNVTNSYLINDNSYDYLWIKPSVIPKPGIKNVISDIDPSNIIKMMDSIFTLKGIIHKEYEDHYLIGLPIPDNLKNDINLIVNKKYTEVSKDYLDAISFRMRSFYFDGSLEAIITQHAIAYNICDSSSEMKEFFEIYYGMKINDANVFKAFSIEDEVLSN